MTGLFWPGIVVAMLFAVHPLNSESVAWIAERKNVLSTFFFILTVLAYMRYAENPRPIRYLLTLILFVLGLMSKAMLVTLPFLLFLLDYWPLRRIFLAQDSSEANAVPNLRRLVLEKIPFLVFTVVVLAPAAFLCVCSFWLDNKCIVGEIVLHFLARRSL